jgi:SAM-dependent MidA family methyltransferase
MSVSETPLETEIRRVISVAGPMSVANYMALCLTHPQHGYYVTQEAIGARGDFTTAPEISQMFGELIGIWAASVFRLMDSPPHVQLVELGPGRGTMMRDVLRATKGVPDFRKALAVHMVEASPRLEAAQRAALEDFDVPRFWHRALDEVPQAPSIILANEFVDALPVHQAVRQKDGWHERVVGLGSAGELTFGLAPDPLPHFDRLMPAALRDAPEDAVFEWRIDSLPLEIGRRVRDSGAALIIDYGHEASAIGDTLQAVGAHGFADPLARSGSVDLTAHVDFEAFGQVAESMGAVIHGPVMQREFLHQLGIESRATALKARATPAQAADVDAAWLRLTEGGSTGMGELFKVMALADGRLGALPGFEG